MSPVDVRPLPGPEDISRWGMLPDKQYLFSKQLSKHSIGAYMELCRGVRDFLEAVLSKTKRDLSGFQVDTDIASQGRTSFSARIVDLESELQDRTLALENLKPQPEAMQSKHIAKMKEAESLCSALNTAHSQVATLRKRNVRLRSRTKYFKGNCEYVLPGRTK